MNKLAVIASGWHYGCQFYKQISNQNKVKGWEIDLFVVSHHHPEHNDTIKEKNWELLSEKLSEAPTPKTAASAEQLAYLSPASSNIFMRI